MSSVSIYNTLPKVKDVCVQPRFIPVKGLFKRQHTSQQKAPQQTT